MLSKSFDLELVQGLVTFPNFFYLLHFSHVEMWSCRIKEMLLRIETINSICFSILPQNGKYFLRLDNIFAGPFLLHSVAAQKIDPEVAIDRCSHKKKTNDNAVVSRPHNLRNVTRLQ